MNEDHVNVSRHTLRLLFNAIRNFLKSHVGGKARLLLFCLILLMLCINGMNVANSYVGRWFMSAIEGRDSAGFRHFAWLYLAVFAGSTFVGVLFRFTEERLGLLWRDYLTRRITNAYVERRLYRIFTGEGGLSNPDQRMTEDVRQLTTTTLSFVLMVLNGTMAAVSFSGVLWTISPKLFMVAVLYALAGSALTIWLGRPLIRLNYRQSDFEANFRSELIHIHDQGPRITEAAEPGLKQNLTARIDDLVGNLRRIIAVNRNLSFFTTGYNYLIQIIPVLIVAPMFIDRKVEFGVIGQSAMAFATLLGAFSLVITQFQAISSYASVIARLGEFVEAAEKTAPLIPTLDSMSTSLSESTECVIVINCGSSSLKFAVLPVDGETTLAKGLAERLGSPEAVLKIERDGEATTLPIPSASHRDALQAAIARLEGLNPRGIGHRMVHGGEEFTGSVLIDDEVLAAVEKCSSLAPLHNPANLVGVKTARELFPDLPQVAVFDTAFHQTLPRKAFLYAIPHSYYEDLKVRRYGFHGTSHHYVSLEAARLLGKPHGETNLVIMHLGNGCSACAVRNGKSVDTTMGLTPSEGLVMGTRSGDVDPALHQFLQDQTGMRLSEITSMLNSKSGLLGLSGISNDMRTLAEAADGGNDRARLAIEVFCYRLAKSVCGLMAALDSIDALVFTGGIGENSAAVRALTAAHLKVLGVELDETKNTSHGRADGGRISSAGSRIPCLVVPTNEELMIARETARLIS